MQLSRTMRAAKPAARGTTSRIQAPVQARPSVAARAGAEDPVNALAFEDLSDIIRMVNETDIVELELKSKRFNLSVKKKEALKAATVQMVQAAPMQMMAAAPAPAAPAAPAAAPAPAPRPAAPAAAAPVAASIPGGVEVFSPMSGTMYRSPAPGEPPFVREGDKVKKGQAVCIVEAMKLMNEIETEVGGEVVKILVENGTPVTPGMPIMIVKP
ncbi:MAG: acetyl-CoA biotin carboxyl carrier [Monoraphidium minutum]|nr:MAG: acetyl-CoA biotin carboxyl carrier [Monoraphidium minutum]